MFFQRILLLHIPYCVSQYAVIYYSHKPTSTILERDFHLCKFLILMLLHICQISKKQNQHKQYKTSYKLIKHNPYKNPKHLKNHMLYTPVYLHQDKLYVLDMTKIPLPMPLSCLFEGNIKTERNTAKKSTSKISIFIMLLL